MDKELLEIACKTMLQNTSDMIFLKDTNLVYRAVSAPFVKMTGKASEAEIIGYTDGDIFSDSQLAKRYEMDDRRLLINERDRLNYIEPITDVDGHPRYGSTSKYLLRNEQNDIIAILGITKDVTTEYMARQRYQQEFKYLFDLPEDTYAVCYIDVDDWRIIKQRRQEIEEGTMQECQTVEEMCAYAIESIVNQQDEVVDFYHDFVPDTLRSIYESGRNGIAYEYERRMSDGSVRWIRNEIHFLIEIDSGHLCVMLSAKDINESKLEEQKMIDAAKLDRMTKVYNRETAMEYIREILRNEHDGCHVLYMLDIDNFKMLNDTLGHQAGDDFLIRITRALRESVRDSDVVGRIGGDEFFIFLRNVCETKQIEKKAEDILHIVSDVAKEYLQVGLSGSIGVSRYPENGKTLDELYAKADDALYNAKRAGKNQYKFAE